MGAGVGSLVSGGSVGEEVGLLVEGGSEGLGVGSGVVVVVVSTASAGM